MLANEPRWQQVIRSFRPGSYAHVQLTRGSAVGCWFAIDRSSGSLLWQQTHVRADHIRAIVEDASMIVADEMRFEGAGSGNFGCYGISLSTGELIWTSHGSPRWNGLLKYLDYVPGFANELRDMVHYVDQGKIYCWSGRVLDVRSGQQIQQLDPQACETVRAYRQPRSAAQRLYDTAGVSDSLPVEISSNLLLTHDSAMKTRGAIQIKAIDAHNNLLWQYDSQSQHVYITGNYYSYRLVGHYVYLVVAEEPNQRPKAMDPRYVIPYATRWHLQTLDVRTGQIVQSLPLGSTEHEECRIEDADAQGLIISCSPNRLLYFASVASARFSR